MSYCVIGIRLVVRAFVRGFSHIDNHKQRKQDKQHKHYKNFSASSVG